MARTPSDVIRYFKDTGNAMNDVRASITQMTEAISSVPDAEAAFYAQRGEILKQKSDKKKQDGAGGKDSDDEEPAAQSADPEERKRKKAENR